MNESIQALWSPGTGQLEVALMVFPYSPRSAGSLASGVLPASHRPPRVSDPHPVPEHAVDIGLSNGFPQKP